jgi:single-strand DNA-binding protein
MSSSINNWCFSGNLGRDPELRYTTNGTAILSFSVAISKNKKQADGNWKTETFWVTVILWDKYAESMKEKLAKGYRVLVIGELKQEEFEDKEGNKRSVLKVFAQKVEITNSKPGKTHEPEATDETAANNPDKNETLDDDDLPF